MSKKDNSRVFNFAISVIFLIMQYAVSLNIFLMGDDFMYAVFAKNGIIKSVYHYYQTGNGRWILNLLDSTLLKYDRLVYSIVLPWILLSLGILCCMIVNRICGVKNNNLYPFCLILISIMDISMTRETTYWITGGMNYLVPAVLFFATIIITLELREENHYSIIKKICLGFICIIACMTMEQFALMSLGFMVLMLLWDIYKKRNIDKIRIIFIVAGVLGLCTILFAPGNMVRISDSSEEGLSIILRILDLFYFNFQSLQARKYLVLILLFEGLYLYQNKNKYSWLAFIDAIILMINLIGDNQPKMYMVAICVMILFFTSCMSYILIDNTEIKANITIFVILLSGSQFIVFVAGIIGFRTTMSTSLFYIIFILLFFNMCEYNKKEYLLCSVVAFVINPWLGIITACFSLIMNTKYKVFNKNTLDILMCLLLIISMIPEVVGFGKNRAVHLKNISVAEAKNTEIIKIENYVDEQYGWNPPPLGEFHEKYFRLYHDIDNECEIEYSNK